MTTPEKPLPWGLLAPALAVAALLVHLLPDRQPLPAWPAPYPLALLAVLAGTAAWAVLRPRVAVPLAVVALVLGIAWDALTGKSDLLPLPFFPGPGEVFAAIVEDRWLLLKSAWHSLRLLACGYLAGAAIGLATGMLLGWSRSCRFWGMPFLKLVGPVPATALVPLAMILAPRDLSFLSGASLIAFAVWFPVTMLTAAGIASVRLAHLDVARTLGAGRWFLLFRVALPSAMPHVFLGLFQGLGASFLTLVVAETVGVDAGLGAYLLMQKGYAEYGKVYAALLLMAVFFSAIMSLLFAVRDRVLRWQKGVLMW